MEVRVRRVYDEPCAADGARVLVDRVWPRGLRKEALRLDDWARDAAPSAELRTWYGHAKVKTIRTGERIRCRWGQRGWRGVPSEPGHRGAPDVLDGGEHPGQAAGQLGAGRRRTDRPGPVVLDNRDVRTGCHLATAHTKALRPVIARPTISVLISRVPS